MRTVKMSEARRREKKMLADKIRRVNMQAARLCFLEDHGLFCDICKLAAPIEELSIRLASNHKNGKKKRSADSVLSMANEEKKKKLLEGVKIICGSCHHSALPDGSERSAHGIRRYQLGCRCPVCRMAMRLLISIENGGEIPGKMKRKANMEKEVKAYGPVTDSEVQALPLLAGEGNKGTSWQMPGLRQGTPTPDPTTH